MTIRTQREATRQVEALKPVLLAQLQVVDKTTTLAASKDVAAYQGIMTMQSYSTGYDEPYNPSETAEARREADRDGVNLEEVDAADAQELRDVFA